MIDPIVAEVRAVRDQQASALASDLKAIFRDIKAKQRASGREYLRYPSRPVVATTPATSNR